MQRTSDEMLNRLQGPGNPVILAPAGNFSSNYTCVTTKKICAISSTSGTVIMVTICDDDGTTTQHVPLPAPGIIGIQNVTVVEKATTDANNIVVWYL